MTPFEAAWFAWFGHHDHHRAGTPCPFCCLPEDRVTHEGRVTEMRVCEIAHLILRPGQLYRFTVDPNCDKCLAYFGDGARRGLNVAQVIEGHHRRLL